MNVERTSPKQTLLKWISAVVILFALLFFLASTLVWQDRSTAAQGPEFESDLALLGAISAALEGRGTKVCWLGAPDKKTLLRIQSSTQSMRQRFKLWRSIESIGPESSVSDIESCLNEATTAFVQFPPPDLSSLRDDLRAELSVRIGNLATAGTEGQYGFKKASIIYRYPDGTMFHLFEKPRK